MTEANTNPLWLTWERVGSPSPSRDFPRAGAFSMWLREKWKQYKLENGLNALPRRGRNSWEQNDWLRMKYREQFHKWLEEQSST